MKQGGKTEGVLRGRKPKNWRREKMKTNKKERKGREKETSRRSTTSSLHSSHPPNTPQPSCDAVPTDNGTTESIDDLGLAAALDTALPLPPGHFFRRESRRTSCLLRGESPPPNPVSVVPSNLTGRHVGQSGQGRIKGVSCGQVR